MSLEREERRAATAEGYRALHRVLVARAVGAAALVVATGAAWLLRPAPLPIHPATTAMTAPTSAPTTRYPWLSVDGKHWTIAASERPGAAALDRPGDSGCPRGMVRVRGPYVLDRSGGDGGEVERLQDEACTSWIGRDFPARCRQFDEAKLAALLAPLPRKTVDVCIDRFEYPNTEGAFPVIVVTYREAAALCAKDAKRLCSEREWTFACEGPGARPYPYGHERDASACVIDEPWREFNGAALRTRDSAAARDELDRLWQGAASGARPACRSVFGVHDLTGNVDEWTTTTRSGAKHAAVLKGGYWGPVRARCRPATRAHDEQYVGYQQGFRCCAPPVAATSPIADSTEGDAGSARAVGDDEGPGDDGDRLPSGDGGAAGATSDEDDDEQQALTTNRGPGIACRAQLAPGAAGAGSEGLWRVSATAASALLWRRRRRPRRDAGGEDGTRTHV